MIIEIEQLQQQLNKQIKQQQLRNRTNKLLLKQSRQHKLTAEEE